MHNSLQQSFKLDLGESEAIALAQEIGASQLLIDEKAARKAGGFHSPKFSRRKSETFKIGRAHV